MDGECTSTNASTGILWRLNIGGFTLNPGSVRHNSTNNMVASPFESQIKGETGAVPSAKYYMYFPLICGYTSSYSNITASPSKLLVPLVVINCGSLIDLHIRYKVRVQIQK